MDPRQISELIGAMRLMTGQLAGIQRTLADLSCALAATNRIMEARQAPPLGLRAAGDAEWPLVRAV